MNKKTFFLALMLVAALALPAVAEVEEITAGGAIHVRGQVLSPGFGIEASIPDDPAVIGFDDDIDDESWVTQRTLINLNAQLTGGVRAFAEIQAFDFWGSDLDDGDLEAALFPSVGVGSFAGQGDDVLGLYQSYIEMGDIGDMPLMLRIGRQELVAGREWLIGNNNDGVNFSGLAFDAVKASYANDLLRVDAWWSKLVDLNTPGLLFDVNLDGVFEPLDDADTDFMGVYGTYTGIENMAIDAYLLYLVTQEDAFVGASDDDNLYTVGARVAGCWDFPALGLIDYNVEGAFQFGDTAAGGDHEAWAFDAIAGYTFDEVQWAPRVEAEYAFFSGDDDPNDEDVEQFSRLFSDVHYGDINLGGNLDNGTTNMHIIRAGVSAIPADRLTLRADLLYFLLAEEDGAVFGAPKISDDDDTVGLELDLAAEFQYTDDLLLRAGWAHFFADDAIADAFGNDDDLDYLWADAELVF